jgi:Ssp1 endopeptidase immunity protein Rap1a
MKRSLIVLAAVIPLTLAAKAGFDGSWLLKQCEAVERHNIRKANKERFSDEVTVADELSRFSSCTAYVAGALDTRFIHCFPPGKEIPIGDLALVVLSWLRANPDRLRENGSVLVLDAIDDKYHCEG